MSSAWQPACHQDNDWCLPLSMPMASHVIRCKEAARLLQCSQYLEGHSPVSLALWPMGTLALISSCTYEHVAGRSQMQLSLPRRQLSCGRCDLGSQLDIHAYSVWHPGLCLLGPWRVSLSQSLHEAARGLPKGDSAGQTSSCDRWRARTCAHQVYDLKQISPMPCELTKQKFFSCQLDKVCCLHQQHGHSETQAACRPALAWYSGMSLAEVSTALQVLNVAYGTVAGLCTFIGATGYYMYGSAAKDLITFNLPAVCVVLSFGCMKCPLLWHAGCSCLSECTKLPSSLCMPLSSVCSYRAKRDG